MTERLDYIIAVSEEQNITRAAKRLFISQPALTKYISKLEDEYNITIFDRTTSPITLTEAGRIFLDEKIKISIAEQNLRNKLKYIKNKHISLTIGIGISRGNSWLPPILHTFCENHPEVDIHIECTGERKLPELMKQSAVDIAIGAFNIDESFFIARTLTVENFSLVVPLKYGLFPENFDPIESIKTPYLLKPEQLDNLNYIAPTEGMGSYEMYLALANQYSIQINQHVTTNNPSILRKMIRLGLGYSYCPIPDAEVLHDFSGNIISGCATLPGLPDKRYTYVMYPKAHKNPDLLSELSELIVQMVNGHLEGFKLEHITPAN